MTPPTRRAQPQEGGDILKRARWVRAATLDRYLVAQARDGGNVLATITRRYDRGYLIGYTWTAGGRSDDTDTLGKAERAARKALREAGAMPVQLTKQQAEKMGLGAAEKPATPRKRKSGGVGIPRAGQGERTGLSTMIRLGWSVQSPDSIRYRLFVINKPALDTGLCENEKAACPAAKALEKLR